MSLGQYSNHCGSAGVGLLVDDIFDGDSDALTRLQVFARQNLAGRSHDRRFLVDENGLVENQLLWRHPFHNAFNVSGKKSWGR